MLTRRNFLHVIAGGLGYISLQAIIPNDAVFAQEAVQPMTGKKRKFADRNLVCRSYIRDYHPGETVEWGQDQTKDQGCEKCTYEETCIYSGTRLKVNTDKTRTFMPEMWDKNSFQNEFVNKGF